MKTPAQESPRLASRLLQVMALLSWFPLLTGCAIKIAEQEVYLKYDQSTDALDFLIISKGVTASDNKEDTIKKAKDIAYRVLEGRRVFMIEALSIEADLDEMVEDLNDPDSVDDSTSPEKRQQLLAILDSCQLIEVEAFLDKDERLSVYQHFHMDDFSRFLDYFNTFISRNLLESMEQESFVEETPLLDDRSRELWRQRAESGEPWLHIVEGELEIDLPITRAAFDRVQRGLIDEIASGEDRESAGTLGQLLIHLRHYEIGDEFVILSFGAPLDGIFKFVFPNLDVEYDAILHEALLEDGVIIDETIGIEGVREILAGGEMD